MTTSQAQVKGVQMPLLPKKTAQLVEYVLREYPVHKSHMSAALPRLPTEELETLETYLSFCVDQGKSTDYLGEAYLTIVEDTLREQMYFNKHKKYRHASYADVANDVYHNDVYMDKYMYGLAMTTFLWPNHLSMHRFFQESLPKGKKGKYIEIGPGHGFNLMRAMQLCAFDAYRGVDISQASINQTRKIIDYYCASGAAKMTLDVMDFLEAPLPTGGYDAVVMGEVLEHVENPVAFLKRIHQIAADDAYIFVTTCTNAPAIDHIFLYKSPAEVEDQFREANLSVVKSLYLPYEGKTVDESLAAALPINVAYVLKKV